jgi:2-polyprenyl-3-methyl-5-hydroxy-6-metoxy-1,4-benzoquinol methylase
MPRVAQIRLLRRTTSERRGADVPAAVLNKTMDRDDLEAPEARRVVAELDELVEELRERDLRASSWYGSLDADGAVGAWERANRGFGYQPLPTAADDRRFPWFLYWEIAWIVINNEFLPGARLLDLGGSSSLFSYYLASKGLEVVTVDLNDELVENANGVAARTGWRLTNLRGDMRDLDLDGGAFDHITSVCVFEHVPISGRVATSARIRDLLRDGGSFTITFDYANPSRLAQISTPDAVEQQFAAPSGLRVRANTGFHDNGKRYLLHPFHHPLAAAAGWKDQSIERGEFDAADRDRVKRANDYTFGALFMKR